VSTTAPVILAAGGRTLGQALVSTTIRRPDVVALEHEGRTWTFRELNAVSNRLAHGLRALGLTRGDRVSILAENRPEYAFLFYAAAKLGVAVSPLNWRLPAAELGPVAAGVGPRLVFVSARYRPLLAQATEIIEDTAAAGLRVVALDDPAEGDDLTFAGLVAAGSDAEPDAHVEPEDILVITHTSGTTGFPKGAALSHRGLIARALGFAADHGWRDDETFVAWSPMYHTGGVDGLLVNGVIGGKSTIIDGMRPDEIAAVVVREPVNWLFLPPGGIEPVVAALRRAGPPRRVRLVGSMADLVAPETIADTTRAFDAPYFNSFGSTEAGIYPCGTSFVPVGVVPAALSKRQSAFCDVRLVDEDDVEVPDGTPGEMLLRCPMLFSGYLARGYVPEADFTGGWFHSGDVLVRNGDGTLDFVERKKYLIKSGGENIYPAEIERLLARHPAVVEAAVVRKPDGRWGEVPVACVAVSDPGVGEGELRGYLDGKLARYKMPKEFAFLAASDFHRNLTGKIVRADLETLVAGPGPADGGDAA
jgi:acyl-CoA synthetase (AMP-forming)/AMP-acid ligase II